MIKELVGFATGSTTWMYAAGIAFAAGGVVTGGGVWKLQQGHIAEIKLAQVQADLKEFEGRRARELANDQRSQQAGEKDAILRKKYAAATALADASDLGLRSAITAGEEANAALSSCVQRANTLGGLLNTGSALAKRIGKEANGHVADKVRLRDEWPQ